MLDKLIVVALILGTLAAPPSDEEIALAQIMQGEAHHQFMHGDYTAAYCVGWVARNRLETKRYGMSYAEVQDGFSGTISDVPRKEYLVLAHLVINGTEDPTRGALYVFSRQDVDRLRFDEDKATLVIRASEHRALIFFAEWPKETKDEIHINRFDRIHSLDCADPVDLQYPGSADSDARADGDRDGDIHEHAQADADGYHDADAALHRPTVR